MSLLNSIINKVKLSSKKANVITDGDLFKFLFDYYTSKDVIDDYQQAVNQLDKTPLNENYQWLLFTGFRIIITSAFYNYQFREKFCQFWLPIYESMFKKFLSKKIIEEEEKEEKEYLSLNAIKYLITNLIEIQQTLESTIHFIKSYTIFQNFSHKDQYLTIIKMIIPLLINKYIIQGIKNDDNNNKIKLQWNSNNYSNTNNVTSTFIFWIILKFIIIYIKSDHDCLISIKYNTNLKNILLKSMKQIKDDNTIKISAYALLTLLINEDDIKYQINNPNDIIKILVNNVNQIFDNNNNSLDSKVTINGVYIIDLMMALKGNIILFPVEKSLARINCLLACVSALY